MNIDKLKFALKNIDSTDWNFFEKLCSGFLVADYGNLRTMANVSGDGGRDAELFSSNNTTFVVFQFSIQKDWKGKINQTIKRLSEVKPEVRMLVFMSNQTIGGQADTIKAKASESGICLDIRDINWFLERAGCDHDKENASKAFIDAIATPILMGEALVDRCSSPLTSNEAKAAIIYLSLQTQDLRTEKGLTKTAFDALVRAALRHTNSENRITREEIYKKILSAINTKSNKEVKSYIDAALSRLTKKHLRHWKKNDEFCLTYEESQIILDKLAVSCLQEKTLSECLLKIINECLSPFESKNESDVNDLIVRIPRIFEKLMLLEGESFVESITLQSIDSRTIVRLKDVIVNDLESHRIESGLIQYYQNIITEIIEKLFSSDIDAIRKYINKLSVSYTLLSFLNQTPDIQSATKKFFSHGKIWIDTSVLLPLLAETILDDSDKYLTNIFIECKNAGTELRVTSGDIHEVISHMSTAVGCSRSHIDSWSGRVPYLYTKYLQTGKPKTEFKNWIETFRGTEQPDNDLLQYLKEFYHIEKEDLSRHVKSYDPGMYAIIKQKWADAHNIRRQDSSCDTRVTEMLINNDIETFIGVIVLRSNESAGDLGYKHWLLTKDNMAWNIGNYLKAENNIYAPLLSISFLVNTMIFGLNRSKCGGMDTIPIYLENELSDMITKDMVELAERIREENHGLEEHVIRRRVRDELNMARYRCGSHEFF